MTTKVIYSIYKATSPNGKSYIGFTDNFKRRLSIHKRAPDKSSIFHSAIRKYGFKNFTWEILFKSEDKTITLYIMETFYIIKHKSHKSENGYNMNYGGSAPMLGRNHSKASRKSMSINTSGSKNPMYGKPRKKATKKKLSKASRKNYLVTYPSGKTKKVCGLKQFCLKENLNYQSVFSAFNTRNKPFKGYHFQAL